MNNLEKVVRLEFRSYLDNAFLKACQNSIANKLPHLKRVYLDIDSGGGDTEEALNFADFLSGVTLETVAFVRGKAYSSAALIFLACQERILSADAQVLFHQVMIEIGILSISQDGKILAEIISDGTNLQRRQERLIARRLKFDASIVQMMMKGRGTRFGLPAAWQYGIANTEKLPGDFEEIEPIKFAAK